MIGYPTVFPFTFLFIELTVSVFTLHIVLVIQLRGKKWDALFKGLHPYILAQ